MLQAAESDLSTLLALCNEPGVREWRFDGEAVSPAHARRLLDAGAAGAAEGLGLWLAYPWSVTHALGCVGLIRSPVETRAFSGPGGAVDVLIAFGAESWADGHAGEAVAALVRHAVHGLCLSRLSVLGGVPGPLVDGTLQTLGFEARFEADTGARRLRLYELDGASARQAPPPAERRQGVDRRARFAHLAAPVPQRVAAIQDAEQVAMAQWAA